jgi:hypothetical protein
MTDATQGHYSYIGKTLTLYVFFLDIKGAFQKIICIIMIITFVP